jgi:alpha-L-arabinofuranosidase
LRISLVALALAASCADQELPAAAPSPAITSSVTTPTAPLGVAPSVSVSETVPRTAVATVPVAAAVSGSIVVDVTGATRPFDRRLLGTNAPAWIGPAKLGDAGFRQRIRDLGTTVVRMPGGSWSGSYDWLACENGDANGCNWTFAATPSDYVGFLAATGVDGMWTVNFNGTAQEAAALVAFFNGAVDDTRVIGLDRNGKDWGTVGKWATLRSDHGHRAPQQVKYWEIGNEVYGAKPDKAPGCAPFGWEDVWTCDGTAYVNGDDAHDGYLKFRQAMLAVDPSILVGAVGIGGDQSGWGFFGEKVIRGAADSLDFYIVHDYGFNNTPSPDIALARPEHFFPGLMTGVRTVLDDQNPTRDVPVAFTEYNMFAAADGDTTGMMSQSINALYIADSIGQMAEQGVPMANQWNLVNGTTGSEGDYGLLDPVTSEPMPQFYGLALWSSFGDELLPISVGFDTDFTLTAHAGRDEGGTITLLVVNKTGTAQPASIDLAGSTATYTAIQDIVTTEALDSTSISYNGSTGTPSNLASLPAKNLGSVTNGTMTHSFDPFSITLLHFIPNGAAG